MTTYSFTQLELYFTLSHIISHTIAILHTKANLQIRFLFSMSIPAIGSSNTSTDESAIRAIAEVNSLFCGSFLLDIGQKGLSEFKSHF